jgi:hypothetical protein
MCEISPKEFIELMKATIWKSLQDEKTRDEMLENFVWAALENHIEFRNLENYTIKLEKRFKKLKCKIRDL